MDARLLKIKLKPNSRKKVDELIEYMKINLDFPKNEMVQKGYFWDSAFYSEENGFEFLYIVIKANDFSKIMRGDAGLVHTPFRAVYNQFKNECWTEEGFTELTRVYCFNQAVDFRT